MNLHHIYTGLICSLTLLLLACDTTIHTYPGAEKTEEPTETVVLIELNVDRTPPYYYKELNYDNQGGYTESPLEPEIAEEYIPDERLSLRLITELYQISSSVERIATEKLVARREIAVDRLKQAPQDTLEFHVPPGNYRALTWADYVPISNQTDWHFETPSLDAIRVKVDHKPQVNHHTSSGAGSCNFSIDLDNQGNSLPRLLDETRAEPDNTTVVPVYLERASGRFKLWATDLQDFLKSGHHIENLRIKIIYKQYVSAGYNVDTQAPNHFVQMNTMETTPTTLPGNGSVLLAYDYVLTSSDQENHVLVDIFIYEGDQELNHYQDVTIPLQRNRETVVKGPFLTKKIGSGDIGIEDDFDDEIVVVIPD